MSYDLFRIFCVFRGLNEFSCVPWLNKNLCILVLIRGSRW